MRFDCIARNSLAALERCGRYDHTQRIAKLRSLMTPFKALFGIALRTARLGAERGQKKHCAGVIQRRCLLEVIERSAIIAGDAYAFAVNNAKLKVGTPLAGIGQFPESSNGFAEILRRFLRVFRSRVRADGVTPG